MTKGNPGNRFSTEVRARAVRMVLENEADYKSRSQAVASIAEKFGCSSATLRDWVNRQAIEDGDRDGLTQSEREELKALQRENRELKQANEILRKGEAFVRHWSEDNGRALFSQRRTSTANGRDDHVHPLPGRALRSNVPRGDDHRGEYGVEAICRVLPIAPSTYHHHQAVERDPSKASLRAQRDTELSPKIKACWEASGKRYGAVKVWYDLAENDVVAARCTVVRLMKEMGIHGVTRGKGKKTTCRDPALPCPEDKVNRAFKAPAPNVLWVADFTYVRTAVGFVYVAFIIDVFARYLVGWQVSSSPNTKLVLDALEQALSARNPDRDRLTHHSDRGVQYLSIKYSERLEEARIGASVGSVGDSYDCEYGIAV
ncbi:IS3 family transposase [Roseovarius sp. SYSU LYC5161]|uniref:IS3 family transposase n=1 Tax=Roseovarius halophilus (ex Wu et al. 2025) TaxID=3376060 RepID=UPI00399AEE2F